MSNIKSVIINTKIVILGFFVLAYIKQKEKSIYIVNIKPIEILAMLGTACAFILLMTSIIRLIKNIKNKKTSMK